MPLAVPVPLLDLKKQYATVRDEIRAATDELFESQGFILGPKVEAFEKAIAEYVGVKHAIGMSSGTDAQLAAMMALGIGPGDDVVTSPYTFFASAGAVVRLGARPVFCDIDPATYNVDPEKLAKAITPRTKAIQPVHLYGQCADMDPILEVAKAKGIPVIEDACQSLGAGVQGKKAGALGEFGAFSFFPSKNLGGFGDGGMVTTNDDAHGRDAPRPPDARRDEPLSPQARRRELPARRAPGGRPPREAPAPRLLGRGAEAERGRDRAALLRARRADLRGGRDRASRARRQVGTTSTTSSSSGSPGAGATSSKERLAQLKIGHAVYYPVPLHLQECFAGLGGKAGDFPESERAAMETLALPVFPELTASQKAFVAYHLAQFSRE